MARPARRGERMTRTDVEFLVKEIWSGHSEEWIRGWKRCIAKTKIQFKKDDPAEFIKGIMVANRFKVLLGYEATKLLFPVPEEQEETKVEEKPESFPKESVATSQQYGIEPDEIKEFLEITKMSQRQFATKMGVNEAWVSRHKTGKNITITKKKKMRFEALKAEYGLTKKKRPREAAQSIHS